MASSLVGCLGCQQRDRRIAELVKENRRLRKVVEEAERENKRQAHPFRRDQTGEEAGGDKSNEETKKGGRKKGHAANLRETPTPEQIDHHVNVPIKQCPMCNVDLVEPGEVTQYQTDLPPILPIITQFHIETGWCPCCRQRWQGRHAEQTSDAKGAAGNTLGPVVLTMAAEMKHRLGVSYRKICDFLETYCHLKACPATFLHAEKRLADLAEPTYQLLLEALRQSKVVHADETGWRIGRVNAWLWVFSNPMVTIYAIRRSRSHDVPDEILGSDFEGFLVVDGLASYDVLEVAKGRCNAHLLRRCKKVKDLVSSRERKHIEALSQLLKDAIDLARRRDDFSAENYQEQVQQIEDRLDDWLDANLRKRTPSAELERLDMHVRKHRGEWLMFLHVAEVPPTNNHAERMLRPAVITRKVGGCNQNLRGALVHSILASVRATCHQRGQRFLDLARQLWQSNQPQAIALEALPKAS